MAIQLSVVDIGGVRYFDARHIPLEAVVDRVMVDAASTACRDLEPTAVHVWILPHGLAAFLPSLEPTGIALFFASLGDPGRGAAPGSLLPDLSAPPRPKARSMAYVDGWAADSTSVAFARECGLDLLSEWPRLVGGPESLRDLLDRARPPR
jgi:hypothetical protein